MDLDKIFSFFHEAGKLKDAYRFSELPILRGKESAADHSWRLSLMAMILLKELNLDLDTEKVYRIAIVHDLAEAITGDVDYKLVVDKKVTPEEKNGNEHLAMEKFKSILPDSYGEEIFGLWDEYNRCETREAKFIKALDKIETMTQLVEAGEEAIDMPDEIASYADKHVEKVPELIPVLRVIKKKLRENYEKAGLEWKAEYDKV